MAFGTDDTAGYSPWPIARQDTPFLLTPGLQGLGEGSGNDGQMFGNPPIAQLFGNNFQGSAPPSNIASPGQMWQTFQGSGGAPSSFAQANTADPLGAQNIQALVAALKGAA